MTSEKLKILIDKMYKKTSAGEVKWEETEIPAMFQASFPGYAIRVTTDWSKYQSSELVYGIALYNAQGNLIESTTNEDIDQTYQGLWYDKLKCLYQAARSYALGVDQALDSILAELDKTDDDLF